MLVAIDDVQWLDEPSAQALVFAARRLADEPVRFLLARRPGPATDLERALERRGLEHLRVGPLSLGATRRLLSERLESLLPRPLLRRVVESTLGNPLFALEVGRTLLERGAPGRGGHPRPRRGRGAARLPRGPPGAADRRLLLAVALSGDLHLDELAVVGDAEAVEARSTPACCAWTATACARPTRCSRQPRSKRSRRTERRELHRTLAGVVADGGLRALHLALATDRPDPELADALTPAALDASTAERAARPRAGRARAAPHPARLAGARGAPARLAAYLQRAGELQRMTDLLTPAVPQIAPGPVRARGWLMLSEGVGPRRLADLEHLWEQALAECPDEPGLRAYALAKRACNAAAATVTRVPDAEAWALEALSLADAAGRDVERLALYALGWVRAMTGRPLDDLCERSAVFADAGSFIVNSPSAWPGSATSGAASWTRRAGPSRACSTSRTNAASRPPTRSAACT